VTLWDRIVQIFNDTPKIVMSQAWINEQKRR
jgi:hypothetical protein